MDLRQRHRESEREQLCHLGAYMTEYHNANGMNAFQQLLPMTILRLCVQCTFSISIPSISHGCFEDNNPMCHLVFISFDLLIIYSCAICPRLHSLILTMWLRYEHNVKALKWLDADVRGSYEAWMRWQKMKEAAGRTQLAKQLSTHCCTRLFFANHSPVAKHHIMTFGVDVNALRMLTSHRKPSDTSSNVQQTPRQNMWSWYLYWELWRW